MRNSFVSASTLVSVFPAIILTSCGPAPKNSPMLSGLVDRFEDGDRSNDLGLEWEAIASGPETVSTLFVDTGGFAPESVYYLTVGGSRPFGASGSEVSGARTPLSGSTRDGTVSVALADVSAYDGLSFTMQGTPGSYIVQLGTAAVSDFDFYNIYVEIAERWRGFIVPFEDFHQEGFGQAQTWTGTDVTHIAFYANLTGPFTFGIDDVEFYSEQDVQD